MINHYLIAEQRIFPGKEAFFLMDSKGLPLEILCYMANLKDMVIDWTNFFIEASKSPNFRNKLQKLFDKAMTASIDAGYNDQWWQNLITKEPNFYKKLKED